MLMLCTHKRFYLQVIETKFYISFYFKTKQKQKAFMSLQIITSNNAQSLVYHETWRRNN